MEIIHVEVNPEVGKREFEKYKQTLFLSPPSSKGLLHIDKMLKKAPKLKSIIKSKAKTNINISPASEAMIELLTLIFLNGLAQEAKAKAFEEKSATIRAQHLKAVSKKMLKKARG